MVEVLFLLGVVKDGRMSCPEVFAGGHQESGSAAGRVADDIPRLRGSHLHHELDNVARGPELAVLPGRGDLAEHVLVEIPLGVPVFHGDVVQQVHHLGQERRGGDCEAGVLHVMGIGGVVTPQCSEERKDMLPYHREHLRRSEVLEPGPAEVLIGARGAGVVVITFREDPPLQWPLQPVGLVLFQGMQVVETPEKEKIGYLLHDFKRIGNAAGPERVPDAVNLIADVAGKHAGRVVLSFTELGRGQAPRRQALYV